MKCDGRLVDVTPEREPAEIEAEARAEAERRWRFSMSYGFS